MKHPLILLFFIISLKLMGQETIDSISVIDGVIIPEHKPTKSIIYMKVLPDIVWNNLDTSTFKKSIDGSNLEIDSLKFKVLDIENQTNQQIHVIDSLKSKIAKIEFSKEQIDSIKADNERHKLLRDKQCEELNFELIDSLEFFKIKSGYYARRLPQETDMEQFYNEIDWIYISESNEVKEFITANFEYCLYELHLNGSPKSIRRQIRRNQEKFDSLYQKCNVDYAPNLSEAINNELIVLSRKNNSICINDLLIFQRKGLIRRFRNESGIDGFQYKYVGK